MTGISNIIICLKKVLSWWLLPSNSQQNDVMLIFSVHLTDTDSSTVSNIFCIFISSPFLFLSFCFPEFKPDRSKAVLFCGSFCHLCHAVFSVHCSLVVTYWGRANLLALLYVMFSCVLSLSHVVSCVRCGTCVYRFLI